MDRPLGSVDTHGGTGAGVPRPGAELHQAAQLLGALLGQAAVGIAVLRAPDLAVEFANSVFLRLAELDGQAVTGRRFAELFPALEPRYVAALQRALNGGDSACWYDLTTGALRRGPTWWVASVEPLRGPDGRVERVVLVAVETTDRVHALAQARARAAELEALFDAVVEPLVALNLHLQVVRSNAAAQRYLGALPYQVHRADAGAVLHPDGRPLAWGELPAVRVLAGETVRDVEVCLRQGGETTHLTVSGAPVRAQDGQVELAVLAYRDVTEQRRLERAREEFLQVAAHELRNPLAGVKGILALLRRRLARHSLTLDQVTPFTAMMEREVDRLASLLGEILDASRVRDGRLDMQMQRVDLTRVVWAALEPHLVGNDRCEFHLDVAEALPVLGDERRLQEVFSNLLGNAVKYSPEGGPIQVRCRIDGDAALVTVADHGIGIPADQLERIFEGFYRAPNLGRQDPGGLGLGLYIARGIIRRHGGDIWARSTPGQGATMGVRLPLAPEGA